MRGPRCPRWGRRRLLALLLAPPTAWVALVMLCPTGWARRAVERQIEARTGCPSRVDRLSIGLFGGVRLEGVRIDEPGPSPSPIPWVVAGAIGLDLDFGALLSGRIAPSRVAVEDLDLRIARGPDGTFAASYLLRHAEGQRRPASMLDDDGFEAEPGPIGFTLDRGRLRYIDAASGTSVLVEDVRARGDWLPASVELRELRGELNGGSFAMAAEIERGESPGFSGQLEGRGIRLGRGMGMLRYLVPYLAGASDHLEGRLDLDLELEGWGPSGSRFRDSMVGRGTFRIDPIRLDGSMLLIDLARVLPVTKYGRVGALRGDFFIRDRRVSSREIRLDVGGMPLILAGGAGFDGRIGYELDCARLASKAGAEVEVVMAEVGLRPEDLLNVRIEGTTDRPTVRLGGLSIDAREDGQGFLDDFARRLRSKLLR